MGNSHSGHSRTSSTKTHLYARKPSVVFSRISFGCGAGGSSICSSESSIETSKLVTNEKFLHGDDIDPRKQSLLAYSPTLVTLDENGEMAFQEFLREYPGRLSLFLSDKTYTNIIVLEYRLTWILDTLRRTDYTRLERTGETYVDYMGGALYPESLIRVHTDFLSRSVLGNTHSVSNRHVYAPFYLSVNHTDPPSSSTLSYKCANEARAAVLSYFNASSDYTVVFTANASAALKLVGEAYPFTGGSNLVIGADSHNSVNIPLYPLLGHYSYIDSCRRSMESENLLPTEEHELVMCRQRPMAVSTFRRRRYVPRINEDLKFMLPDTGCSLAKSSSFSGISAQSICNDLPIQHLE